MTSLTKKLFIANGRWLDRQHIYVCGYSKADAIRILEELAGGVRGMKAELNKYFSKGCWGTTMAGIVPERGAWVADEKFGSSPKRIYPVGDETVIKKDHYQEDPTLPLHIPCCNCVSRYIALKKSPCERCTHYVG